MSTPNWLKFIENRWLCTRHNVFCQHNCHQHDNPKNKTRIEQKRIENKRHENQEKHDKWLIILWQIDVSWDFTIFLFTFMKWFILKNLKISVTHSLHHWHKHFIVKKHINKMRKNIFYINQIINLKKSKNYTLWKSIICVYTLNHHQIVMSFCD